MLRAWISAGNKIVGRYSLPSAWAGVWFGGGGGAGWKNGAAAMSGQCQVDGSRCELGSIPRFEQIQALSRVAAAFVASPGVASRAVPLVFQWLRKRGRLIASFATGALAGLLLPRIEPDPQDRQGGMPPHGGAPRPLYPRSARGRSLPKARPQARLHDLKASNGSKIAKGQSAANGVGGSSPPLGVPFQGLKRLFLRQIAVRMSWKWGRGEASPSRLWWGSGSKLCGGRNSVN